MAGRFGADFIISSIRFISAGIGAVNSLPARYERGSEIVSGITSRHITLAYFDQKSTVDYIGAIQGVPVCFDAKECAADTFPLQNVHPHQVAFMREFEEQGGIAFLIIYFSQRDELYYLPFFHLDAYWERMQQGGRKSFTYEEMDKTWRIKSHRDILVHYLEPLSRDLGEREDDFS